MKKTAVELFAGVGGFRLGLERLNTGWDTVWFSQWEPGKSKQWAHECYVKHFGNSVDLNGSIETTGFDIAKVDKRYIPDHTLLMAGFPCQDYSVAHTKATSEGIEGKKGVLWWEIYKTLIVKTPRLCILENVDRLLKSPAKQRGRDFGIILACFNKLGYSVEWRVVNAALYGAAQRRKRTFIFAYKNDTNYGKTMTDKQAFEILHNGFMAKAFPLVSVSEISNVKIGNDLLDISDHFSFDFKNAGYMSNGEIHTAKVTELEEQSIPIRTILQNNVDEKYYISKDKLQKWEYLKGAKKIQRVSKSGYEYTYSEGAITYPDSLDNPARTMLTSEGNINRGSHVIEDPQTKRLRILTPVETERINGFNDDWTDSGMPERMRYFCMGNALVVPMITRMGKVLDEIIDLEV